MLLFGFFFLFRLDYTTLGSWDEAWYGSIAREMARSGDFLKMIWNGQPYYDHPPMGFWLMAISYRILGISEFSTRLPSAILGFLSIYFLYRIGEKLFKNKYVGFAAGLILGTSVWYLIRVRSGNLDADFVFFYILTVYLSIKSSENFKWFPLAMLSFGALCLTKTLVGTSAILLIIYLNFQQFIRFKNWKYIFLGMLAFGILVLPWYMVQKNTYPDFIQHHFFDIGMRNKTAGSYFKISAAQPLFYLHMGVRKWYYLWILAAGFLIVSLKFLKKNVFLLFLWNFIVLYPFLTSDKTELWHLIPVYVPVSLITSLGLYEIVALGTLILHKYFPLKSFAKKYFTPQVAGIVFSLGIFFIAAWQTKIFLPEVFTPNHYTPDDVDISKRVGKYDKPIFLDDDYLPIAVFYSDKQVKQMAYQPDDYKTLVKLFQNEKKPFVVVTRNWAVSNLKDANLPYRLLEKNNSFSILTNP